MCKHESISTPNPPSIGTGGHAREVEQGWRGSGRESESQSPPFTDAWYDAQFAEQSLPAKVLSYGLILLVRCYQCTLRAVMGGQCRFTPTCSTYAIHAIKRHGPIKGGFKAAYRILRCNPWGGCGWDPA